MMEPIQSVNCERGPRLPHLAGNPSEWEADFCLLLSHAPDKLWGNIFDELRQRDYRVGVLTNFFTAYLEEDRFRFFCRPLACRPM